MLLNSRTFRCGAHIPITITCSVSLSAVIYFSHLIPTAFAYDGRLADWELACIPENNERSFRWSLTDLTFLNYSALKSVNRQLLCCLELSMGGISGSELCPFRAGRVSQPLRWGKVDRSGYPSTSFNSILLLFLLPSSVVIFYHYPLVETRIYAHAIKQLISLQQTGGTVK